jgi:quercetin dioxygenase-like cupin family protein
MLVRKYEDVEPISYAEGIQKRVVFGEKEGAPTFVMRVLDVSPGKASSHHSHDWEHEGLILAGKGVLMGDEGETPIKAGDAFFIPSNQKHSFANKGQSSLRFVCVVPLRGEDTK